MTGVEKVQCNQGVVVSGDDSIRFEGLVQEGAPQIRSPEPLMTPF